MNVYLSFDDGRDDFYTSYLIIKEYGLTGSFHITTGFVDGSYSTDAFGINRKPLTIEQIFEMSQSGMDISSHGDKHLFNQKDFLVSASKLDLWCNESVIRGISVPNSLYTDRDLKKFVNEAYLKVKYIRVGRNEKCYSLMGKISYLLNKLTNSSFFYIVHNKHNIIYSKDKYKINSVVITKNTKISNIISFLNKFKKEKCDVVLMFHSVVDNPTNKWEWSKNNFKKLCKYIAEDENIVCKNLNNF